MLRMFGVCAGFFLALPAASAEAALVKWDEADGGNGHYYRVVQTAPGITFDQALAAVSRNYGDAAHLATVTSAAENAFITSLLPQVSGSSLFLGGFQAFGPGYSEPDGGWRWVTDEPFAYANWFPGEPNDGAASPGNENALEIYTAPGYRGFWNDIWRDRSLSGRIGYVVESTVVPIPAPALLLGSGLLALGALRRLRGG